MHTLISGYNPYLILTLCIVMSWYGAVWLSLKVMPERVWQDE